MARVLPLAEVLNNQGVAVSRQGHDAVALFRQTVAVDPNAADYHFNLGVSLKRRGDAAEALTELAQCLRLRPNDGEAQELDQAWRKPDGKRAEGLNSTPETASKADPLERIARNFDAAAFRQAALMLDQMDAIMVRSGQHCVHSWFNAHQIKGSVRASLYFYNTEEEAARFIDNLNKIRKVL